MSIALDLSMTPNLRAAAPGKRSLVGLSRPGIAEALTGAGIAERDAKMRASQIWNWIYHHGVTDFDRMSNIQKGVRAQLADAFELNRPEIVSEQISSDGTR